MFCTGNGDFFILLQNITPFIIKYLVWKGKKKKKVRFLLPEVMAKKKIPGKFYFSLEFYWLPE